VTADAIARNLGIAPGSEYRYRAGIIHVLGEAAEDGHCFLPYPELIEKVVERLALADHQPSPIVVKDLIFQMGMDEEIVIQGHRQHQFICYQNPFYQSEQHLAKRLQQLLSRPITVDLLRVSAWIDKFTKAVGMQLSDLQRQAVEIGSE
jgi:exodeoxyribonuclease V alpha subunit